MLSFLHINWTPRKPRRQLRFRAGFTILEVVAGVTILGLTAGAALYGLNQLNYYATVNRLYTSAQTLAQTQIDLILTQGPFDPSTTPAKYPTPNILGTGGTYNYYSDPTTNTIAVVSSTATPSPTGSPSITIYRDPMNTDGATNKGVTGTVFTKMKDTGVTVPVTVSGKTTTKPIHLRQATVTVSYRFRRQNYAVVMETMRTADQ